MSELILTDEELEKLSSVTNTLRGINFDRRIPPDTIRCIQELVVDIDTICERLIGDDGIDGDSGEEPDHDLLREDRDEQRRLEKSEGDEE